jgi:tetratricopeptide (TPR) repeat protein
MTRTEQEGQRFVDQVRPIFERQDSEALLAVLGRNWPNDVLVSLLRCGCRDAAKAALVCLSLTGTMRESRPIVWKLADRDRSVAAFAEHAIWSVWFRAGDAAANLQLRRGVERIAQGASLSAIRILDGVIARASRFAEAYHQRAAACFLVNRLAQAIRDCRAALRFNPIHFSAMTFLGHCYAAQGKRSRAVMMYEAALHVHPRYAQARQAVACVRRSAAFPVSLRRSAGRIDPKHT